MDNNKSQENRNENEKKTNKQKRWKRKENGTEKVEKHFHRHKIRQIKIESLFVYFVLTVTSSGRHRFYYKWLRQTFLNSIHVQKYFVFHFVFLLLLFYYYYSWCCVKVFQVFFFVECLSFQLVCRNRLKEKSTKKTFKTIKKRNDRIHLTNCWTLSGRCMHIKTVRKEKKKWKRVGAQILPSLAAVPDSI